MVDLEKVLKQVKSVYKKHYLNPIKEQINAEMAQLTELAKVIGEFADLPKEKKEDNSTIAAHKTKLHGLINKVWLLPEEKKFSILYDQLPTALDQIFDPLEDTHILEQKKERFYSSPDDPPFIKLAKPAKRLGFKAQKVFVVIGNVFRKEKVIVKYWKHSVPFKNLLATHFEAEFVLKLQSITDCFFKELCAIALRIKNWEESSATSEISFTQITQEIEAVGVRISKEITKSLNAALAKAEEEFNIDYHKAGTIEYPSRMLTDAYLSDLHTQCESSWKKNNVNWKNTIAALFEEWRSDLDIFALQGSTLAELEKFQSAQTTKFSEKIDPEIDEIEAFIREAIAAIKKSGKDASKELKRQHQLADKKLDKGLVPKLCKKLSSQNITNLITQLELKIRKNVEGLSDEHVIVKNNSYDTPMESSELKKISPYELIAFESLGAFESKVGAIKKDLFTALQETTDFANDLDQIVLFSLSSAIAAMEEGKSATEAIAVANEGLQRAVSRLQDTRNVLRSALVKNSEDLEKEVDHFCSKLLELTTNENIGELRIRITKAKAAKQAEELKNELREKIRVRKRLATTIFRRGYNSIKAKIEAFENKYINGSSEQSPDREISDFLLESQTAIQNLPLIYRRLYELEPVTDLELFVGRATEYSTLDTAFKNWEQGRYATTAIVGEKWGGLTSFVNYAVKKAAFPYPLTRFSPLENNSSEANLFELMKTIFKNENLSDVDQVVEYLNSSDRQVVILENVQNLYLRKIHGFAALKILFQIINRTYKNVFWVFTSTVYSWDYLCKSVDIAEFFSYTINLENLTEDQIVSIIWKRNRISGFKIVFETEANISDKKFEKLTVEEQQDFLKKQFFSQLNSFAKSNISLALIFWLLSTKTVDKSTITIGSFKKPDLNFLSVLSMEKLYTLHALILHDGLTEAQLAEVLNSSLMTARLNLLVLLEDGIITQKEGIHVVNPIVFRNIVSLLKAKNLIH